MYTSLVCVISQRVLYDDRYKAYIQYVSDYLCHAFKSSLRLIIENLVTLLL